MNREQLEAKIFDIVSQYWTANLADEAFTEIFDICLSIIGTIMVNFTKASEECVDTLIEELSDQIMDYYHEHVAGEDAER